MTTLTTWVLNNQLHGEDFIGAPLADIAPPKTRFLFTVEFIPRSDTGADKGSDDMAAIIYHLKTAGRPNITANQEDINFYGYRAKVLTRNNYGTIQLTFYEDALNTANDLLWLYMSAVSPITNLSTNSNNQLPSSRSEANGNDRMMTEQQTVGPLPNDARDGIFKMMKVHHYYQNGFSRGHTVYTYHNPKIESASYDELDMSSSEASTISITFSVEGINVEHLDESFEDDTLLSLDGSTPITTGTTA